MGRGWSGTVDRGAMRMDISVGGVQGHCIAPRWESGVGHLSTGDESYPSEVTPPPIRRPQVLLRGISDVRV